MVDAKDLTKGSIESHDARAIARDLTEREEARGQIIARVDHHHSVGQENVAQEHKSRANEHESPQEGIRFQGAPRPPGHPTRQEKPDEHTGRDERARVAHLVGIYRVRDWSDPSRRVRGPEAHAPASLLGRGDRLREPRKGPLNSGMVAGPIARHLVMREGAAARTGG